MRSVALLFGGVLRAYPVDRFSGLAFAMIALPENRADRVVASLHDVFVGARATSLLALLFGLGFSMPSQHAEAARQNHRGAPTFVRLVTLSYRFESSRCIQSLTAVEVR